MSTPDGTALPEIVHLVIDERIATVTLDSEGNRNALSRQLMAELSSCLARAEAQDDVGVILIRSAGPAFCSGADLYESFSGDPRPGALAMIDLQRQIVACTKPIVVELNGPVRAGGLGIVGAADVVIAAESVTFQLTEVRLALAAAIASLTVVPRLSSRAASDLLLTARVFGAHEAATAGLITRAVPDREVQAEIDRSLADLLRGHPQGIRETKSLLNAEVLARIDALGSSLADKSADLFASPAARQAIAGLRAKRPSSRLPRT